jgi:hypothetical protein
MQLPIGIKVESDSPPNQRMKLSWRGGRLKEKGSILLGRRTTQLMRDSLGRRTTQQQILVVKTASRDVPRRRELSAHPSVRGVVPSGRDVSPRSPAPRSAPPSTEARGVLNGSTDEASP